jgi:hypothetical protein
MLFPATITALLTSTGLLFPSSRPAGIPSYAADLAFLKKHATVVELRLGKTRIAVVPQWQGRVMTSTLDPQKPGFGFLNRDFIKTDKFVPHMNVFGGEDRIWLGPEGGQFSLFFKKGQTFDLAHWQTPPIVDTIPFRVTHADSASVMCEQTGTVKNYSGTKFTVKISRTIKLLTPAAASHDLKVKVGKHVQLVGYETVSSLTNEGKRAWTERSGLLSLWVLGMLRHSPTTTVVIPYKEGPVSKLGPVVNDNYFGKVPSDRLEVYPGVIYFKADGKYRSKIGLNPRRALNLLGSWDPVGKVLTVVQYKKPANVTKYVNSMWEIQKFPFSGDCLNSYNDGPPAPGKKPLGPFYEVESSSPAAALAPGASITHFHRTFHFSGSEAELDVIARKLFGVKLKDVAMKAHAE